MKLDKTVIESHPPGERPFRLTTYVVYLVFGQFKHPRGGEPKLFGAYASWDEANKEKESLEWKPGMGDPSSYAHISVQKIELQDTTVREPI